MRKKLLALALTMLLCLGFAPPAQAAVEELASLRVDEVVAYSGEPGVYTVRQNGLYGFYRADGSVLLEPNYAAVGPYSDGMAAVSLTGEETGGETSSLRGGQFGYVDAGGVLTVAMHYRQAFPFSEGLAFAVDASGTLVLLDRSGQELASFPQAELWEGESVRFSEGLAVIPVKAAEETARENESGEDAPAENAPASSAPRAYLVLDSAGGEVCTLTDAYVDFMGGYHSGRIAAAETGEWVLDEEGRYTFTAAPGSWGYRDERGEAAIAFRFDEAAPFTGELAAVCLREGGREAWGFVSPEGEMAVPASYDGARSLEGGAGALLSKGKWAYTDQDGRLLTGFDYEEAGPFRDGIALVRCGGRTEAVNERGRILFTVNARRGLPFSGGVTVLQEEEGGAWGVCDEDGDLLVPFEYEQAFHWDGYLWLKRGELWRVYRTEDVITASLAAPAGAPAGVGSFLDVPEDAWYAAAVTWATDHDVITGTGGNQFSPDRSCTTGEIVTFLWRALGRPEPSEEENPFTDVSATNYYYQAALWAYENGVVSGGVFGAAELCSRGMAVTYLWRLAGSPEGYPPVFADVSPDEDCAQAVSWAVCEGVTGGSGGGVFSPGEICSRGQIVTFLYRFLADN